MQDDNHAMHVSRRQWLALGGATAAAVASPFVLRAMTPRAPVFVARQQSYAGDLEKTIADGLQACGIRAAELAGKHVLLKPNLVEPSRLSPQMTTHPAVIIAAAEVFRRWGARVRVGEAPGHVRDTEHALMESGVGEALLAADLPFEDLNYDEVVWAPNQGGASKLDGFYFPRAVMKADLIVSMPKMKTHHWMGVTAAMKNMYGIIPGIVYGWPKNVLHHAGIPETVFDINASAPPTIAIVDGVQCMEGDGPIMGTPKDMGLLIIGANLPAVDATVCRLMDFRPERIPYLSRAANRLGPIHDARIEQRGERWEPLRQPFQLPCKPHLKGLQNSVNWS